MKPSADECEVTVFGSGCGECVLIHIGGGRWIVIDSCVDADTKSPVALDYLRRLGVDVSLDVCMIIATHWHEDHIRGLSTVFKECATADFMLPAAVTGTMVKSLMSKAKASPKYSSTGVYELTEILSEVIRRKQDGQLSTVSWI